MAPTKNLARTIVIIILFAMILRCDDSASAQFATANVSIVGTVKDSAGLGIPGVAITLVYHDWNKPQAIELHTESNDEGRYTFDLTGRFKGGFTVVAWKEGFMLGAAVRPSQHYSEDKAIDGPLEMPIILAKAEPASAKVVDDGGLDLKSGAVGIVLIDIPNQSNIYLRQPLSKLLVREIQPDGLLDLDFLPQEWPVQLAIQSTKFGQQRIVISRDDLKTVTMLQLRPATELRVEIESPDKADAVNREISIDSYAITVPTTVKIPSNTRLASSVQYLGKTDSNGTCTAIVAVGKAYVGIAPLPGERIFASDTNSVDVGAGQANVYRMLMQPGLELTGRALTLEDEPVANVAIQIRNEVVVSDINGEFKSWVPKTGRVSGSVIEVPVGCAYPYDSYFDWAKMNPDGTPTGEVQTSPVIRLRRAMTISGDITDQAGVAVAGAAVVANWIQEHESGSYFTLKYDWTKSDDAGRFQLEHVPSGFDVLISATTDTLATNEQIKFYHGDSKKLDLKIVPEGLVQIAGLVRGSVGQVIRDAKVVVSRAMSAPNDHVFGYSIMSWDGDRELTTTESGRFKTPRPIQRLGKYSVQVTAPGYLPLKTPFQAPPNTGNIFDLREITLIRTRTAEGIVRDSSGKPLEGVSIIAPSVPDENARQTPRLIATTDRQGSYKLEGLHPQAAMATVEKEGYQLSSVPVAQDQNEINTTLFLSGEPIPEANRVHPRIDIETRHAAARKIAELLLSDSRKTHYVLSQGLTILARIDKESAVRKLEAIDKPEIRAGILGQIGEIDDAMAETNSIEDGFRRAFTRLGILDYVTDPEETHSILANVLGDAVLAREPESRVSIVARVARRLTMMGRSQEAETLLREHQDQAEALGKLEGPAFARGSFAEQLAVYDPIVAFKLINEIEDPQAQFRHYLNTAQMLAGTKPDLAEAALKKASESNLTNAGEVRIAYNMAAVDLPRAIRLVEAINEIRKPAQKAQGLAALAHALKKSNPEQARQLLRQAMAAVSDKPAAGGSFYSERAFGTAMMIAVYAEEIDPDNLSDYYSQVIKRFPGPSGESWTPDEAGEKDAQRQALLAIYLSLYENNQAIADQIMEPVFKFWEGQIGNESSQPTDNIATFVAMALTDPARAVDWSIRFHKGQAGERAKYIPQPREVIGHALSLDRAELMNYISEKIFHLWVINKFDF